MANRNTKALRTRKARHGKFVSNPANERLMSQLSHAKAATAARKAKRAAENAAAQAKWDAAVAEKKRKDSMILIEEELNP